MGIRAHVQTSFKENMTRIWIEHLKLYTSNPNCMSPGKSLASSSCRPPAARTSPTPANDKGMIWRCMNNKWITKMHIQQYSWDIGLHVSADERYYFNKKIEETSLQNIFIDRDQCSSLSLIVTQTLFYKHACFPFLSLLNLFVFAPVLITKKDEVENRSCISHHLMQWKCMPAWISHP